MEKSLKNYFFQEFRQAVENFNKNYGKNRLYERLKNSLNLANDQNNLLLTINYLHSTPLWNRDLFTREIRRDLELLNQSRNIIVLECNRV